MLSKESVLEEVCFGLGFGRSVLNVVDVFSLIVDLFLCSRFIYVVLRLLIYFSVLELEGEVK